MLAVTACHHNETNDQVILEAIKTIEHHKKALRHSIEHNPENYITTIIPNTAAAIVIL